MDAHRVFAFLAARLAAGEPCVLATVVAVEGSAMRGPGTHMGIAADGDYAGSLSGGCIEAAVVAEARDALTAGQPRVTRFGAGSPYLDIRLPCGGGLDIHFQPLTDEALVAQAMAALADRRPFTLAIGNGPARIEDGWGCQAWDGARRTGAFGHWPALRLLAVGHGAVLPALCALARTMDVTVAALTPDARIAAELATTGVPVQHLAHRGQVEAIDSDPWTAIAFLFHDHDWETALIARALAGPAFYVGAMGGRRAHAARSAALAAAGAAPEAIAAIHAPIGLFHSSRDPESLALATLAQIVRAYQDADFTADCTVLDDG